MTTNPNWGRTPWDDLPRDELLRTVQRQWAVLEAVRPILETSASRAEPESRYWGYYGLGGRALSMIRQVQRFVDTDQISRYFFQYAVDLLFVDEGAQVRTGWMVCDADGLMMGGPSPITQCRCGGPMRPLAWSDLEPHHEDDHA